MKMLDKLDRKAGQWLKMVDGELQQPVSMMLTGEVFTSGTTDARRERLTAEPAAVKTSASRAEANSLCGTAGCSPVLRNADA